MIMRLMSELYRGEPAAIPVGRPPEHSARLLKEGTRRWRGLTFMDSIVGSVAVDRVVLHRSHRSLRNAFAPIFRGRFTTVQGRTYLTGSFALRRSVQVFMTVWFCFIVAFCLIGVVVAVEASLERAAPFWLAVVAGTLGVTPGLALGLLGLTFVRFGRRLSKADIDEIVEHVKSTAAKNVVGGSRSTDPSREV